MPIDLSDLIVIPSGDMKSSYRREWNDERRILVILVSRDGQTKGRGILGFVERSFGMELLRQYRHGGDLRDILHMDGITSRFGADPDLEISTWSRSELTEAMASDEIPGCENFLLRPRLGGIARFIRIASLFMTPFTSVLHKAKMDRIDQNILPGQAIRRMRETIASKRTAYPMCISHADFWMPPACDVDELWDEKKPLVELLDEFIGMSGTGSVYRDTALHLCSHAAMLGRTRLGATKIVDLAEGIIRRYWASHSRAPFTMMMKDVKSELKRIGSHIPYENHSYMNPTQERYIQIREMTRLKYDEGILPLVFDLDENMVIVRVRPSPISKTMTMIGACFVGDDDQGPSPIRRRPVLLPSA